jgi:hypothetical protein
MAGVDDLTRSEHVRREVRKGGAKGVFVGLANAGQQSGGEGAPGKAEVVVPSYHHAVDVHHSRSGIGGVICGRIVRGAIATINRFVAMAGGDTDRVDEIYLDALPFCFCHHEGEGSRDVMHGAHTAGVSFNVLGPVLQFVTRVINERWGDVACRCGGP